MSDQVRGLIRFKYLNLMKPWPFSGPFDFIFCRNVMIYFDKPTQEKLVNRFAGLLAPGGVLFTGHSESLTGITHPLRYVEPTHLRQGRGEGRMNIVVGISEAHVSNDPRRDADDLLLGSCIGVGVL